MSQTVYQGIIARYKERLPITADTKIISLHEGNTPLIPVQNFAEQQGIDLDIWLKFEGLNPTGSFKDRGMTMAITQAVKEGSHAVICASTGNTSASAAAYAARANLQAFVIIPDGKIAKGKLAQAIIHGAKVIQIAGNFDKGLALIQEVAQQLPLAVVNSINPYRLQGQKTIAFEICDVLNKAPDYHYLPVGNAGNISAHWMGYQEYLQDGLIKSAPVMVGFQAENAAPLVLGHPVQTPETIATAIRIGNPASKDKAIAAQQESGGWFDSCSDQEILQAQQVLASTEGVFCEPASAISIAGLCKDYAAKKIKPGSTVVCTLTGNGLKDTDIILQNSEQNTYQAESELPSISKLLEKLMK